MLVRALLFIILWSLPWNPAYHLNLRSTDFAFRCDESLVQASYSRIDNTISICPDALPPGQLKRTVIHESQHHMQWVEGMAHISGGWLAFERAAMMEAETGGYTEHQRDAIYALVGAPVPEPWYNELHAELPNILGLDIPESLCPWYPWFCEN